MTKSIIITLTLFSFISCKQPATSNNDSGNISNPSDSMVTQWNKVWNSQDSAGIADMLTSDAQFVSEGTLRLSKDSICNTFIRKHYKLIRNLETKTINTDASENLAYYYGSYSHDVQLPDTLIKGVNGTFSFIIKKSELGWKLKVIGIEENAAEN
jgi:ketosteroid isomerase-like protein